ncbi:MAG: hypothetical protein R3F35_00605 [Myxococcota bacterium]
MSFSNVLREAIEQDDGLVLRLSTYQRMHADRNEAGGQTAGLWGRIQARSRKILAAAVALCARPNEEK